VSEAKQVRAQRLEELRDGGTRIRCGQLPAD